MALPHFALDLGRFTRAVSFGALQRCFVAVDQSLVAIRLCSGTLNRLSRPFELLVSAPRPLARRTTHRPVEPSFTFIERSLTLVRDPLTLIGNAVTVGRSTVALIGSTVTLIGSTVALIGLAVPITGLGLQPLVIPRRRRSCIWLRVS